MDKPLVSIIIPNYNCKKWLKEAVNSAINQSYKPIEIIIVDDGSDKFEKKNLEEIKNYPYTKVFELEKNYGVAYARNFAINKANGEIILPLDCDDKLHQDYIKEAVNILIENHKIKIVYCDAIIFGENINSFVWELPDFDLIQFLLKNQIHNSALFWKRDYLLTSGYDNTLEGLEDWDFWISLIEATKGIAYKIPKPLFYYRKHKNSRQTILNQNPEFLEKIRKKIVFKHLKFYAEILGDPRSLYMENQRLKEKLDRIVNSFRWKLINFVAKPIESLLK